MAPDTEADIVIKPKRFRPFTRPDFKTSFITGIVVSAPIFITLLLLWSFVNFVDDQVRPVVASLTPESWQPWIQQSAAIPGLGLLLLVAVLTLVGMLTANMVGRTVLRWSDALASKIPIVGSIYGPVKQIIETVAAQSEPAFKEVCLIEYPQKGMFRVAFLIGTTKGEIRAKFDEDMVTVFMPSTPNPMAGYVMFMPRRAIKPLAMTIEQGIKIIVSAGIVTPDLPEGGATAPAPRKAGLLERFVRKNHTAAG
ncbi:MAG: DUF502 domain-containing protein [Alphaproteobacteria bacterium]